jgi:hypothetical protein
MNQGVRPESVIIPAHPLRQRDARDEHVRDGVGLERRHFRNVASGGFGDPLNAYPHTMAWFNGRIYVGTTRANFCLLKGRLPFPMMQWPVRCPQDVYELDLRAQIWRYDPEAGAWDMAHRSPLVAGKDGASVPREIGYRGMTVYQGPSDPGPALYIATWAPSRAQGSIILRSLDGEVFEPVSQPGLGVPNLASCRSLVAFNGRLFTAPIGRSGGKPNTPDLPVVLVSADPARGGWHMASAPGFGDAENLTVFEMAAINGHLYAGTLNPKGYQVWKTTAEGQPPYRWTRVLSEGAGRGPENEGVLSMYPFRGALYVGSCIPNGGYDLAHKIGPAAPELIRIHPDDTWDLLVGDARATNQGWKPPLSEFGPGFANPFCGYFWRMAEFDGFLYLGTLDWSVLLPYVRMDPDVYPAARRVRWLGVENVVRFSGGFDLFRSQDGVTWAPVTTSGFGNPYNFGVRNLVPTPYGLFVGAANPFGPEIAIRTADRWEFAPNPRGGAEVWLGSAEEADDTQSEDSGSEDSGSNGRYG